MNLQPGEFIAKTQAPDNNPQRTATYNMVPGTVVRLRNHIFVLVAASQWIHAKTGRALSHEQFAARMRKDPNNLPVILFDPLDTDKDTDKDTDTDTYTDKENNND